MSLRRGRARAALLGLALAAASAVAQAPPQVRLTLSPESGSAGGSDGRPVLAVLRNGEAYSVSLDSITFSTRPLAGVPQPFRRLPLPGSLWQAGAGDSLMLTLRLPAVTEDSWRVLAFHVHTHDGRAFALRDSLRESGAPAAALPAPAQGRAGQRSIEFWRLPPPAGAPVRAGLLLLRDEGMSGADDVRAAVELAAGGYAVVLLNAPGTGLTSGPADVAGPNYRAAALAALDTLAAMPGVRRDRIAVWGIGTGGTLALLLGESRSDVRAVVAQGATPDLWAAWRAGETEWRTALGAAATRDSAAWRARSPAVGLAKLRVPTLVLHGERDPHSPSLAVHAFVAALQRAGAPAEGRFFGVVGRTFASPTTQGAARRFLDATFPAR